MPQLLLRGLTRQLVTAVRDYARARALSTPDAATELVRRGLADVAARQAGAAKANAITPEARADRARVAAQTRWHGTAWQGLARTGTARQAGRG